MCDMSALDDLVANTAYLRAQGGDEKELKKRRRSLVLPEPSECEAARAAAGRDFQSLCELQPIGKKLFRLYLKETPEYAVAADFLDELSEWELAEGAAKDKQCADIINRFCREGSQSFLSVLSGEALEKCRAVTEKDFREVVTGTVSESVREFLKGKPFTEYMLSAFFRRFLQWKEYERQPISDKYFYQFRTLGKGGFGEVCAVQVKNTGQMYACKKLCKKRLKKKQGQKMAMLERKLLEKVNSPFVVSLVYAYESKSHLCLVMTLMNGGDLKYHIYNLGQKGMEMKRVVYYSAQIASGMLHLHAMNVVYRDMKPDNVLLDSHGQCRLSDLGLAIELQPGQTTTQKAGTPAYMAPEVLSETPYRTSVDWWSLGVSIYEMVAGYRPFQSPDSKNADKDEVKRRIINDEPEFQHKNFDPLSKDIITQFLRKKMEERLGCRGDDPREHEWFKPINFPRLEAGLIPPPWLPKPNVVYAKDAGDIAEFSDVKGIEFDASDAKLFKEFSTGAISIPWQKEMIDTGLFDELNDPNRKENSTGLDQDRKSGTCTLL